MLTAGHSCFRYIGVLFELRGTHACATEQCWDPGRGSVLRCLLCHRDIITSVPSACTAGYDDVAKVLRSRCWIGRLSAASRGKRGHLRLVQQQAVTVTASHRSALGIRRGCRSLYMTLFRGGMPLHRSGTGRAVAVRYALFPPHRSPTLPHTGCSSKLVVYIIVYCSPICSVVSRLAWFTRRAAVCSTTMPSNFAQHISRTPHGPFLPTGRSQAAAAA